jgi:DNA polymerase-1
MSIFNILKKDFKNLVVYDFEYRHTIGNNPEIVCGVFKELKSGKTIKATGQDLTACPYPIPETLFIAFNSNAEAACMLELGWGLPKYVWDPYVIQKKLFFGKIQNAPGAFGLLRTALRYGITEVMSEQEKTNFRDLILNNKIYTTEQLNSIIDYCLEDVLLTEKLFYRQLGYIEINSPHNIEKLISQHIFHSTALAYTAKVERNGIPVDNKLYNDFQLQFPKIKDQLIDNINQTYDIYENGKFNHDKFEKFIKSQNLFNRWPLTNTGKLKTDRKTVYNFSLENDAIAEFRLVQEFVNSQNLRGYQIGNDGRSRCSLNMFGQKTGRTNASPARYPFGGPRWARTFITPQPEHALVYMDFKSQEPAIQFALSGDENLKAAYESGDIYIYTAQKSGVVPVGATKKTHPKERSIFKVAFLASNYGQGPFGLARALDIPEVEAKQIIKNFKDSYPVYYKWIDDWRSGVMAKGYSSTKYGWSYHFNNFEITNPRSLLNWPIQSHGSEILRFSFMRAIDAGIEVVALVHDALMIHCHRKNLKSEILKTKEIMMQSSKQVIGYPIPVDIQVIRNHFEQEEAEKQKWDLVMDFYKKSKLPVTKTDTPSVNVTTGSYTNNYI